MKSVRSTSGTSLKAVHHEVGDVQITRIEEQCGPSLAPEVLLPDWDGSFLEEHRSWLIPDCYSEKEGKFISSRHSWLVRTAHHTILIDTCAGNNKERPGYPRFHHLQTPYLDRLRATGVAPEDVDFVLCTHLHVDHCGWNTQLIDGRWTPTFPKARYVFSRTEHDLWSTGTLTPDDFDDGQLADSVLPVVEAGLADMIDGAWQLGDELTIRPAPGHSPGHCAIHLLSHNRHALFSGDTMHQPVQVYRPEWNSRFCEDADLARRTRRLLLEHSAEKRALVLPAHFGGSHAGFVSAQGGGFSWQFA